MPQRCWPGRGSPKLRRTRGSGSPTPGRPQDDPRTTPGADPRTALLQAVERGRELDAGPDAELGVGVAQVELDGVHGDHQDARDLLVGQPLDGQLGDPPLGRREPAGRRGPPRPTRSSSARASSAHPGDPIASNAAAARSRTSRAAPHFLARRCARPSASSVRASSKARPSSRYDAAAASSASPASSV